MTNPSGTLRAIGQALSVSDGTVSRALSGRGQLAQETRDRIVELAAEMNYTPRRRVGKGASSGVSRVAVCVGNPCVDAEGRLDPSYVGLHFVAQLERAASAAGIGVMVAFVDAMADDQRVDRLPMLQPGETQGVVLVYPFPEPVVRQLAARVPVVSIEHVYPSAPVDVIGPTHALDAMSAVEHLHRLGHRRIGFVSDEDARGHHLTLGLRHAGFVSGLARCGLDYRPDDVVNVFASPVPKADLPAVVAARIRDGVTAVVTSIDRHAYLLWDQLPRTGLRVPADVSLVGICGIYRAAGLSQLTTWRCDYPAIASAALHALEVRRARGRPKDLYQELASTFVAGESSAPPAR